MPLSRAREAERLEWLRRLDLLDVIPEQVFDDIVRVAARLCQVPMAAFTVIDETRQVLKASLGTHLKEMPRDEALSWHALLEERFVLIEDLTIDPRYAHNPFVAGPASIRFYAGAPVRSPGGEPLGMLCVLDRVPRTLDAEQAEAIRALARQIEQLLEARLRMREAEDRERRMRALEGLLRKANDAAMREATLLSALMDHMPEPVVVADGDFVILRFNKAAEETFGHRASEVVGQPVTILHPTVEDVVAVSRESLATSHAFRGEGTAITKSGVVFPVEVAAGRISVDNDVRHLAILRDLRDQRRAAETLFASNELFRHAFDRAPVGMALVEIDGTIHRVNEAMCKLLGLAPEQLVDRPVSDFVLSDSLDQVRSVLPAFTVGDAPSFHIESTVSSACGNREVIASVSLVRDLAGQARLYAVQLQDITARRAAEAALRESEAGYRMVAEHATDVISRLSVDGHYLYVTPSVQRATGFPVDEIMHRSAFGLFHPDDHDIHRTASQVVLEAGREHLYQHRLLCKDSSYRWFETSARPVRNVAGDIIELHAITRDISERRAAEQRLIGAREAAESASRAKSVFLGNMSHELRTPLNAILGFARVLERERFGALNDHQTTYVRDIIESGTHMLVLVEELLELRALEDGLSRFVVAPVDLKSAFDDAHRMTRELAVEKRHELVVEVPPALMVLADYRAVVQVLVNLVSNAIKYTPVGGRIHVSAAAEHDMVSVHVLDNGIGMTASEQTQLFREFERLGRRAQGDAPGTGLGLALTRRLVESLGGVVSVHSAPGEGSRFSFTLRRAQGSVPARAVS